VTTRACAFRNLSRNELSIMAPNPKTAVVKAQKNDMTAPRAAKIIRNR
jgi:hypothetical protein